jgi:quercetin dioxygenase-like cupin family protein
MADETLALSSHETVKVVRNTPEELELEATWKPGGQRPPEHMHPSQVEHFEVRSGRLTALVGRIEQQLGPGDTLQIPAGTAHKIWNSGSDVATAVWRTRPAGRTHDFFSTIDRLGVGGTRKPPLTAMAKAVNTYSDVFRLVIRPKPLQPLADLALRLLAMDWR